MGGALEQRCLDQLKTLSETSGVEVHCCSYFFIDFFVERELRVSAQPRCTEVRRRIHACRMRIVSEDAASEVRLIAYVIIFHVINQ